MAMTGLLVVFLNPGHHLDFQIGSDSRNVVRMLFKYITGA
jgi:hypothetical protein